MTPKTIIDDFNVRGQRFQVAYPGKIDEYKFCPQCGAPLDRTAMKLLSFKEAYQQYEASKKSAQVND